uniref:Ribosomal protein S11 n=1 Tax=Flammulina velutipes TaxID=38945 RepID=D2JY91_FLAVE|nr:ribosomal protein S11 [Flammulina velutipes]
MLRTTRLLRSFSTSAPRRILDSKTSLNILDSLTKDAGFAPPFEDELGRDEDGPPTGMSMRPPPTRIPRAPAPAAATITPGDAAAAPSPSSLPTPVTGYDKSVWPHYRIYCKSSNNNTIITFTDDKGMPIAWSSAGRCGFKGTRGATPEAAYAASVAIIQEVPKRKNGSGKKEGEMFLLDVYLTGFGIGRGTLIQTLASPEGEEINSLLSIIRDNTPIKVGGVRAKKARRI